MVKNGTLADQQNALRNLATEALELVRILEEVDDLLELLLRFVDAGDIVERHPADLLGQQSCARFAEAHGLAAAGLHLAHEEHPDADQKQHREPGQQDIEQRRRVLLARRGRDPHALVLQGGDEAWVLRRVGRERAAVAEVTGDGLALDVDRCNLPAVDLGDEVGVRQLLLRAATARTLEDVEESDQQKADDHPKREIFA
jgi:hypothetical protein